MTDLSPLGQAALDYAAKGWHVFPLVPNSKDPLISKRMGGRGFWDATTDLDRIRRWWTVTPDANIGLGLIQSGLVCVDADTYRPDCEWPTFISGRDLPDTLVQRSASGGTHYLFRAPRTADYPGHLCKYVDIKHKGYIVLEPSTYEGRSYQWQTDDEPADAPDWLTSAPPVTHAPPTHVGARLTLDPRIRAYCDNAIAAELAAVRNAQPGTRNNTLNAAAFAIGQIVEAGYADEADMIAALTDAATDWDNPAKTIGTIRSGIEGGKRTPRSFPMEDEPPFDRDAAQAMADAMWEAFERKDRAAALAIAQEAMAARPQAEPLRQVWGAAMPTFGGQRRRDIPVLPAMTPGEFLSIIPDAIPDFPISSFGSNIPGLLGLLADYLDRASATSTEAGGLAVAIPILGAIMGRAYRSPSDLRTNVYTVAIGGSGTGKTALVNPAKEIMTMAKASHLMGGDDFASDSGLIKMLSAGPKVSFLDEFGHKLQQLSSPGAGIHAKQIISQFTKLYSAANTIFTGKEAAVTPIAPIDCPHLCLFGMATPQQFWDAFGSGALEDGSVARYLVFPIGKAFPKEPDRSGQGEVVETLTSLVEHIATKARNSISMPCQTAPMTPDAACAQQTLFRTMDAAATVSEEMGKRGAPAILRRVAENATKIALISAVGRNHVAPEIDAHDFAIGHALAQWSAIVMINNIASRIADNNFERSMNRVERRIMEAGPGGILRGVLVKSIKLDPREMTNILSVLEEAGLIIKEPTKSTKPGYRFTHITNLKGSTTNADL